MKKARMPRAIMIKMKELGRTCSIWTGGFSVVRRRMTFKPVARKKVARTRATRASGKRKSEVKTLPPCWMMERRTAVWAIAAPMKTARKNRPRSS